MGTNYNKSTLTYNNASTPYRGVPTDYAYVGSVTVFFTPNHSVQYNSLPTTFIYNGSVNVEFLPSSVSASGMNIIPETNGVRVLFSPSSTATIRRYLKIKDPIRTGGCPQCGTFLYNRRS